MKKIFLVISIISILLLAGCNKKEVVNNNEIENIQNQEQDEIVNNSGENETNNEIIENYIDFNYTTLADLKNKGLIPEKTEMGKLYHIGNIKLDDKVYKVKYIVEEGIGEPLNDSEEIMVLERRIKFYLGNVEKLEFLIDTEDPWRDYIKEISIFKNKYLVTVTNNYRGDTLQFLEIYDEKLNKVKVTYDNNYQDEYIRENGRMVLNNMYENYYTVNEDDITYIRTDESSVKGYRKVTIRLLEINEEIKATIIEETTDGVLGYAGQV